MNWYKIHKFANPRNIVSTLGIPLEVAKMFTQKVGDKWDFIAARWFLNYSGVNSLNEDYGLPHSEYASEANLLLMHSIGVMSKLVNITLEDRIKLTKKDEKFSYFYWDKNDELWPNVSFKNFSEKEMQEGLEDELIQWNLADSIEKFNKKLDQFLETDFFRDLVENKTFNKQQCKNLSFGEAMKEYLEVIKVRNMPVVLNLGDYRWVNSGTGLSDYVREKMRNCGKASWGALRSIDRNSNEMLLLLDKNDNPHVIATWVPNYVDYERPDEAAKKFLGSIEGVASSVVKEEYYPYIKALFEHLKPDLAKIPYNGEYHNDKMVSNENLINELGLQDGNYYGIQTYPGPKNNLRSA